MNRNGHNKNYNKQDIENIDQLYESCQKDNLSELLEKAKNSKYQHLVDKELSLFRLQGDSKYAEQIRFFIINGFVNKPTLDKLSKSDGRIARDAETASLFLMLTDEIRNAYNIDDIKNILENERKSFRYPSTSISAWGSRYRNSWPLTCQPIKFWVTVLKKRSVELIQLLSNDYDIDIIESPHFTDTLEYIVSNFQDKHDKFKESDDYELFIFLLSNGLTIDTNKYEKQIETLPVDIKYLIKKSQNKVYQDLFKPNIKKMLKKLDIENFSKFYLRMIGQEKACEELINGLIYNLTNISTNNLNPFVRPAYILNGFPGHGKTYFAESLSNILGHDKYYKVDMSTVTIEDLFGAADCMKGKNPGHLTNFLNINNGKFAVVCLDEFDKVSNRSDHQQSVYNYFLPIFEKGVYISPKGYKIDTSKIIWLLTANVGLYYDYENNYNNLQELLKKCFKDQCQLPLYSRIFKFIPFLTFDDEECEVVLYRDLKTEIKNLKSKCKELCERDIEIIVSDEKIYEILYKLSEYRDGGYETGVRGFRNIMVEQILEPITFDFMTTENKTYHIREKNNEIAIDKN